MPSIFLHHGKLWVRLKGLRKPGKWDRKRTEYVPGQEKLAERYAEIAQTQLDRRASDAAGGIPTGASSVDDYAEWWFTQRKGRIASVDDERGRYAIHIRPHLGHMTMSKVLPEHVRNMVREHCKLVKVKAMASRSARHCYAIVRGMFRDAVVERKIHVSPAGKDQLGIGELPQVLDKDGEWRSLATYELWEVQRLISDPEIPPDRRVAYALKALAGLRHSDMNACRWRNYQHQIEPLGRLVVVTPKTGVTRFIPVHPLLAKILAVWKLSLWHETYGRAPTDDDFIVLTRAMTLPDNRQSGAAFQRDLATLELRQAAGEFRNRGGHDLRSWFTTSCKDDGAREDIVTLVTHAKRRDVVAGYTRSKWITMCTEIGKLQISLSDDKILPLSTTRSTKDGSARIRWASKARRMDRRSIQRAAEAQQGAPTTDIRSSAADRSALERAELVSRLSTDLATAVLAGDQVTARRLALELAEAGAGALLGLARSAQAALR